MHHGKLPDIGTTIFTVMSQLAADCDAINLSQGYPDFAVPERLLERVIHLSAQPDTINTHRCPASRNSGNQIAVKIRTSVWSA